MSVPGLPEPARLVVSVLTGQKDLFEAVAGDLTGHFGRIDLVSRWLDFDYTDYYEAEMGSPLWRRMLSFQDFVQQQDLAGIKRITNEIEGRYSHNGRRQVNLDPGYLLRERLVLATGKNYAHRIYIGGGIYADLTLMYQGGTFQPLPWTYPDYAAAVTQSFLTQVRDRYVFDSKNQFEQCP